MNCCRLNFAAIKRFVYRFIQTSILGFELQYTDREIAGVAYDAAARDLRFEPSAWADFHDMPLELRGYLRV